MVTTVTAYCCGYGRVSPEVRTRGSSQSMFQCTIQLQHKVLSSSSQDLCSRLLADTRTLHCETLGLLLMKMLFSMLLSLTGPTSAAAVQWSSHGYPEWSRAFTQHGTIFMCYSPNQATVITCQRYHV